MKVKHRVLIIVLVAALVASASWAAYATRRDWIWMPLNPQYTLTELKGKSASEVRELLGKPYFVHEPVDPAIDPGDRLGYLYTGALGEGIAIDFDQKEKVVAVRNADK